MIIIKDEWLNPDYHLRDGSELSRRASSQLSFFVNVTGGINTVEQFESHMLHRMKERGDTCTKEYKLDIFCLLIKELLNEVLHEAVTGRMPGFINNVTDPAVNTDIACYCFRNYCPRLLNKYCYIHPFKKNLEMYW